MLLYGVDSVYIASIPGVEAFHDIYELQYKKIIWTNFVFQIPHPITRYQLN